MYRLLIGLIGFTLLAATSSNYPDVIRHWQDRRNASLRAPDGWLALVGLFWLHEGQNSIGSDDKNDCVLPKGSAPAQVGSLKLSGKEVVFIASDGSSQGLSWDEDRPTVVRAGSVSFYVIRRGEKFAVRAKDSASPALKEFAGLQYFDTNPELHFQAKFIPDARKIPIVNILGVTEPEDSPGIVEFDYRGKSYRLRPIFEGKTLFFLFKDPTNKTETYQAGRMLNTPLPKDGRVDLDFNRSYNPPCTFTPYATCPLPPKENTLPFAVNAGERRYGHGHAEYSASR